MKQQPKEIRLLEEKKIAIESEPAKSASINISEESVPERISRWDHDYAIALIGRKYFSKYEGERLSDHIPGSFAEALKSKFGGQWIAAMNEEFDSHELNQTWSIVDKVPNSNIIKTCWVYFVTYGPNGGEIAKARLVARGDVDSNRYNIEETYSPVVTPIIIRYILSLIHTRSLFAKQLDIKTTFLYGVIDEDIYLEYPDGLECKIPQKVLKINKALYGLKTASKKWNERLSSELDSMNFSQSVTDSYLFFKKTGRDLAILMV